MEDTELRQPVQGVHSPAATHIVPLVLGWTRLPLVSRFNCSESIAAAGTTAFAPVPGQAWFSVLEISFSRSCYYRLIRTMFCNVM